MIFSVRSLGTSNRVASREPMNGNYFHAKFNSLSSQTQDADRRRWLMDRCYVVWNSVEGRSSTVRVE